MNSLRQKINKQSEVSDEGNTQRGIRYTLVEFRNVELLSRPNANEVSLKV